MSEADEMREVVNELDMALMSAVDVADKIAGRGQLRYWSDKTVMMAFEKPGLNKAFSNRLPVARLWDSDVDRVKCLARRVRVILVLKNGQDIVGVRRLHEKR